MVGIRKRIIELVTKVTGAAELKKAETSLRKIDKSTAAANKQLRSLNKSATRTASALGSIVGAAAAYAGARGFGAIINATVEQEKALAQLEATLISTGNVLNRTSQDFADYASELQTVTAFGDEAVIGAQSLLLTFKNIQEVNFDRTTEAVLDLSTAMGQDLKSSAIQLGKALNDPAKGLAALSRVGVGFTDEQAELIKTFTETGQVAEAQIIILKELESQFGGSARAARNTLGGALDSLKNNFGDLLEASENGINPLVESVNKLSDIFTDPSFKDSVNSVVNKLLELTGTAVTSYSNLANIVGFLGDEFAALFGVVSKNDLPRLLERQASLQERINRTGFFGFIQNTEELERQLDEVNAQIKEAQQRLVAISQLQPIEVTAERAPDIQQSRATFDPDATQKLERTSQRFIDLAKSNKILDEEVRKAAEAEKLLRDAVAASSDEIARSNELFAKYNPAIAQFQQDMFDLDEALRLGVISQKEFNDQAEEIQRTLEESQEGWTLGQEAIKLFGENLETTLDGVLQGTQTLKDGFKDMVSVILVQLGKLAANQLFANFFGSAVGGVNPGQFFAKGGVLDGGIVQKYVNGGIVNKPTLFPMANGAGLMGEAGPEAILPLSRTSSGNLGVEATGFNVTINNNAPGVSVAPRQDDASGLTIDVVLDQVSSAIRQGGNGLANSIEESYSLNRGRAVY